MKIGQRVICIDDKNQIGPGENVIEGEIYYIRGLSPITTGVYVENIHLPLVTPSVEQAFFRRRFRPIDEDFAEAVLKKIIEEIKKEQIREEIFVQEELNQNGY